MASKVDSPGDGLWILAIGATTLVAVALRVAGLRSGLWYDEIATLVLSVRHPLGEILTEFPGVNQHPFYSVLAHASIGAFGESVWALRLPACLFGIASVVMVFYFGVMFSTRVEAWAAATVLATSYHHIWFSQNARGYTMLGFFVLLSTYSLLRALRDGRPGDYVLYTIAGVTGVYTHLTMALVIAGHAIVVLVGRLTKGRSMLPQPLGPVMWAWAGVAGLSALAYAPFARSLLAIAMADEHHDEAQFATAGWALSETIRSLISGVGAPAALVAGVCAVAGALSVWRRQPLATALLLVPGVVTGLVVAALGQPFRPRFFFFLSGAAALLVSRGIGVAVDAIASRAHRDNPSWRTAGIVGCTLVLVAASAAALPQNYQLPKQDFDGTVRYLEREEAKGAGIAAAAAACWPFEAFYGKTTWRCLEDDDDWRVLSALRERVLVAYTLPEYIQDATLRERLRADCPVVQRFRGSLGGGDIVVCEPGRSGRRP